MAQAAAWGPARVVMVQQYSIELMWIMAIRDEVARLAGEEEEENPQESTG